MWQNFVKDNDTGRFTMLMCALDRNKWIVEFGGMPIGCAHEIV